MGCCCPQLGWVFSRYEPYLDAPSRACPETCHLGDSKSCQVGGINHHRGAPIGECTHSYTSERNTVVGCLWIKNRREARVEMELGGLQYDIGKLGQADEGNLKQRPKK